MADKDKNGIDDDEGNLFRDSVGPVKSIKHDRIKHQTSPKNSKSTPPKQVMEPEESIPMYSSGEDELTAGDRLDFFSGGIQHKIKRKLRRGQIPYQATLDLHGMTSAEASKTLAQFIASCQQQDLRCVLVIHGKGYGSEETKPVLKNMLNQWLRNSPLVAGFCSATPKDGGTGAAYVLLKRMR
jgi:DNA-nicking Smr family endonuclease